MLRAPVCGGGCNSVGARRGHSTAAASCAPSASARCAPNGRSLVMVAAARGASGSADGEGTSDEAPKRRGRAKAGPIVAEPSAKAAPKKRGRRSKADIEAEAREAAAAAASAPPPRAPAPLEYISSASSLPDDGGADAILEGAARRRADGSDGAGNAALAALGGGDSDGSAGAGEDGEFGVSIDSIISEEARAVLAEIEPKPWFVTLPPENQPRSLQEVPFAEALVSQVYWDRRLAESKAIEDRAWQHHHMQNQHSVNRYAMVRRVARIMAEVENYDFLRQEKAPQHIPPWARAEVIFESEYEEFNQHVADNIEAMTRRYPKEAEEEELDILDDALFLLSRDDDNNVLNTKVAQQTEDHALVDRYLDNILPGVSLASLSESYADDIFAGGDDHDDLSVLGGDGGVLGDGADDALGGAGAEDDGEEAAPAPPKRRGRPPKAAAADDQ